MTVPEAMLLFALVAIPLTVMPGLDSALVLRTAVVHGNRHAYATALGVNAGVLAWGVAAAVGATAVLAASETAYRVLTMAGAAYLVSLGGQMLWSSFQRGRYDALPDEVRLSPAHVTARSPWRSFAIGATTNLLTRRSASSTSPPSPSSCPTTCPTCSWACSWRSSTTSSASPGWPS
ncbi:LysE family transporter [Promicromonospora sp. NPDC023987]|uniref:LysE family translocator n=1 Tax=Promicromonospora sp. NPDC023987 TaxID=3155360 RepID=UPI0033C6B4F3